jgi:hypothetical protein
MLEAIQCHLGMEVDAEAHTLEEAARPEEIAREIETQIEKPNGKRPK